MLLFGALELVVDLGDRLVDEEEPARDEDEVLPRERNAPQGHDGFGERDDPARRKDEADTDEHRERKTEVARPRLLLLGELGGEDRDEDDVVDAQHDLKDEQRDEDRDQIGSEGEGEVHADSVGPRFGRALVRVRAAPTRETARLKNLHHYSVAPWCGRRADEPTSRRD